MNKYVEFEKEGGTWKVPDAFYRVSAKLVVKNETDELLVYKDINWDEYEVPGGGVDWGETHIETLKRELKEEIGVELSTVDPEPFASEYAEHRKGYHTLKIYYMGSILGEPTNNEPDELALEWVDKERFAALQFQSEEAATQKHIDAIWPDTI